MATTCYNYTIYTEHKIGNGDPGWMEKLNIFVVFIIKGLAGTFPIQLPGVKKERGKNAEDSTAWIYTTLQQIMQLHIPEYPF